VVGITVQASLKEALSGSEDKACAIAQPRANAFAVESGKLQGERVCCEAQDKSAHFARRVVRVCSGEREAPRRTRLLRKLTGQAGQSRIEKERWEEKN
jgi:hypothetical protein